MHWGVPINHMVVMTEPPAKSNPETVKEIYRVLLHGQEGRRTAQTGYNLISFPLILLRADLHCRNYALQQSLIPRKIDVEELFNDTMRALEV